MTVLQQGAVPSRPEFKGNRAAYLALNSKASLLFYLLAAGSVLLPLLMYAYLGTFTRYAADDYCATVQLRDAESFWQASVTRYLEWSGGYSNLLFIQIGEWFGMAGMIYMAPAVLILWLLGLTWLVAEIGETSGLRWNLGLSFVLAELTVFFSLYLTQNAHKILYWRSSLVGYLAAVVLLAYLSAFMLHQLRVPARGARLFWNSVIVFIGAFIIGGTSETIDALQIGLLLLALLAIYAWKSNISKEAWILLGMALLSAILSLLIMALSPGNLVRMKVSALPAPNWFALGIETLTYVYQFILSYLRVSPLPSAFSFILPFLLFWGLQHPLLEQFPQVTKKIKWMVGLAPIAMVIAIAFSFAPHAYARSFPSVYVRFPGLFLFALTLMTEGCLLGILLRPAKWSARALFRVVAIGLVILAFLYPVRAAIQLYNKVTVYQAQAAAWDARDEYIRQSVAAGATDLVVVQLDSIGQVQEYKGTASFWVNRCAADYYGLRSLRAP